MNFSSVVFGDTKGTNGEIPGSERQQPGILEDGTLADLNINNNIDLDASQQTNLTFLDVLGLLMRYLPSIYNMPLALLCRQTTMIHPEKKRLANLFELIITATF
jgi:hypothetical protein